MDDQLRLLIIGFVFVILGALGGYLVFKIKNRSDRRMNEVLNNPALLINELKKHGKIYDIGPDDTREEIEISYDEKNEDCPIVIKRNPQKVSAKPAPVIEKKPSKPVSRSTARKERLKKAAKSYKSRKSTSRRSSMTERPR